MKPSVLRKIADELINISSSGKYSDLEEGFLRTSIEKSYYFAFSVLKQAELNLNMHVSKGPEAHKEISSNLESFVIGSRIVGYKREFKSLRQQRNNATYDLATVMVKNDAITMLVNISKFLERLSQENEIGIQIKGLL